MTQPHSHIATMAPYALAQMAPPPGKALVSLAQNESLRPPSPLVIKAAAEALADGAAYPDPDWTALRHALADLHGIAADQILCGNGSLDLIGCLMRVYAGPQRSVLMPAHSYPFFRTASEMAGAAVVTAPEQEETVCVDTLLAAVAPETSLVCVANPGNPTGTRIPKSELLRLRAGLRDDVLLIIDEAYGEYCDDDKTRCWDMVEDGGCVVLRTFSKAYGMAGFRVGWGLFPAAVAAQLRKVMNPNNVPHASQVAAAAALGDQAYMRETCQITGTLRDAAHGTLQRAGFDVVPSHTNFLLIRFDSAELAQEVEAALIAEGIFLRRQQGAGLPHALRMTMGPETATRAAIARLIQWKTGGVV
ncbi:histidinol-phosphate transaminase [uncultured Tateyamaria sp.]|uniref:pyridoxal phosphate-dependent aminotransferase n=1 Tax=uncultured Tateyamaria sp. TaxID=455651 RepID=UPI00260F5032|nr:histidinol-phosphate transaminase [uncultured Tateyamaria sp.]